MERLLERLMFNSRWLLAPLYLGLVGAILLLVAKFVQEFLHFLPNAFSLSEGETVVVILSLIDMALVGNLLIIIIFSGYENFVSKIDTGGHEDRPDWMGKVSFSDLKMKLIGSIVAISGIELLKSFMHVSSMADVDAMNAQLGWQVGIHLTFVVSGLLFALTDRLGGDKH
jgi:uncharacterized protein (TIGR00645 family)